MHVCEHFVRFSKDVKVVPAAEVARELARRLAMRTVHGPVLLVDADAIRRLWIEEFHAGERAA